MNGLEAIAGDVGIDLSGGNIGVAEKFLNNAQVGTALQKMGRERMAKGMGRNDLGNAGQPRIFFDHLPDILTCESCAVPSQKKMIRLGFHLGPHATQIRLTSGNRDTAERHKSLLVPFPATLDELIIEIDVLHRDLGDLGDPIPVA